MSAWDAEDTDKIIRSVEALVGAVRKLNETLAEMLVELRNITVEIKHHD